MTSGVIARRLEPGKDRQIPAEKEPAMSNSRSARHNARPEPPTASFASLLIQDAIYVDPIMDAWGQDVVRGLIEGIQAGIRGSSIAVAKLIEFGRSLEPRRAPPPTYGNRSKI
jgi:hypothetical protein